MRAGLHLLKTSAMFVVVELWNLAPQSLDTFVATVTLLTSEQRGRHITTQYPFL
jgi:hypothetical protein